MTEVKIPLADLPSSTDPTLTLPSELSVGEQVVAHYVDYPDVTYPTLESFAEAHAMDVDDLTEVYQRVAGEGL